MSRKGILGFLILAVLVMALVFILWPWPTKRHHEPTSLDAAPDLAAHSEEFRKEVIRVTEGVYVAVGFGLANSILLEGTDGVVIVDTMESAEAAASAKKAFSGITTKPVKAIIYTHFHTDHINGTRVLAGEDRPEIYAHETTLYYIDRVLNLTRDITFKRAMRQFGVLLPEEALVNAGIGPRLFFSAEAKNAFVRPTKTFSGELMELDVAGLRLLLIHAPGETPDQVAVWFPEKRVLMPADNFYKSFPNLYAIRGTAYRDVMLWVRSLDKMRQLNAQFLVPHHTRPITGQKAVLEALTDYRDAIQFVHDQTIRWMNRGLTPEEIVERVKLPAHLAEKPYLKEYYGTVAWSVRAIFDGYLGWFSGNATDLNPLPIRERARRIADLAGGQEALLGQARLAASRGDHQWALELADLLLGLEPESKEARGIKASALRALAQRQTAATGRNYYLTQALEVEGKLTIGKVPTRDPELIHSIPLAAIFSAMSVNLDPLKSANMDQVVGFHFPDTGEEFMVHVRRGVAEIRPGFQDPPKTLVRVDSKVWKEIVAGLRNPVLAYAKGDLQIQGSALDLAQFLGLFKSEDP